MRTVLGHWDVYELLHRQRSGEEDPLDPSILPVLRAGSVAGVWFAVAGDSQSHAGGSDVPLRGCLETLDAALQAVERSDGAYLVRDAEDVVLRNDQRVGFLFVMEGGRPLAGSLAVLRQFFRLGVRCLLLTWNGRNELADGVGEGPSAAGLSAFGRAVVREMRRLGMILDLSHLAERGFYQAVELHGGTVVATHSNARALHDHPRNLTDEQVRAVAATDGVVGVAFMPAFLGPGSPTVATVVRHLAYYADLVGAEHVAIGPDFSYAPVAEEHKRRRKYEGVKVDLDVPYPIPTAAELPRLIEELERHGFSASEIAGILGGNLDRVAMHVLPSRASRAGP